MKTQPRRSVAKQAKTKVSRPSYEIAASSRPQRKILLCCFALAVLTIVVYVPAIFHSFVDLDDGDYVTQNAHVQSGLNVDTIRWALTSTDASNWHPLTWMSHALDCQLYELDPRGHHLTNVLLHAANVVLLFLILQWGTGSIWKSGAVASLFALHPLNVESVAWVAERKNVLSTFFFFLSLAAYGRYVRRPNLGGYLVVAAVFVLGLASKPMLVTLPFLLLLLDYWPLARIEGWSEPSSFGSRQISWPRLLLEKTPLLALSAGSSIITMTAQAEALRQFVGFRIRLWNAFYSYADYILKIFWPVHRSVLYPFPFRKLTLVTAIASAAFLAGISAVVWLRRKRSPYAIVGWLWFLGTLVPVIGIVQVGDQGMADRYLYIPAIGLFVIVVWGLNQWARWQSLLNGAAGLVVKGIAGLVLVLLAVLTIHQIGYWSDSNTLWGHTLEVTEDNFAADDHVANLLLREGRIDEANRYFEAAARAAPLDPVSHGALAAAAEDRGDLQEAIRDYRVALDTRDQRLLALTYVNLAVLYGEVGDYATARQNSEEALRHDPQVFRMMIQLTSDALQSAPEASGYVRLGFLYEGASQTPNAKAAFERALQLDRTYAPAQKALEELSVVR